MHIHVLIIIYLTFESHQIKWKAVVFLSLLSFVVYLTVFGTTDHSAISWWKAYPFFKPNQNFHCLMLRVSPILASFNTIPYLFMSFMGIMAFAVLFPRMPQNRHYFRTVIFKLTFGYRKCGYSISNSWQPNLILNLS